MDLSATVSDKILRVARAQEQEMRDEAAESPGAGAGAAGARRGAAMPVESDDDDSVDEYDGASVGASEYGDEEEITEEEERAFAMFMSKKPVQRKTIADLIMEKLAEGKGDGGEGAAEEEDPIAALDPKVIEVYTGYVGRCASQRLRRPRRRASKALPCTIVARVALLATMFSYGALLCCCVPIFASARAEWASTCKHTALARCPKRSRSSQISATGKRSCL